MRPPPQLRARRPRLQQAGGDQGTWREGRLARRERCPPVRSLRLSDRRAACFTVAAASARQGATAVQINSCGACRWVGGHERQPSCLLLELPAVRCGDRPCWPCWPAPQLLSSLGQRPPPASAFHHGPHWAPPPARRGAGGRCGRSLREPPGPASPAPQPSPLPLPGVARPCRPPSPALTPWALRECPPRSRPSSLSPPHPQHGPLAPQPAHPPPPQGWPDRRWGRRGPAGRDSRGLHGRRAGWAEGPTGCCVGRAQVGSARSCGAHRWWWVSAARRWVGGPRREIRTVECHTGVWLAWWSARPVAGRQTCPTCRATRPPSRPRPWPAPTRASSAAAAWRSPSASCSCTAPGFCGRLVQRVGDVSWKESEKWRGARRRSSARRRRLSRLPAPGRRPASHLSLHLPLRAAQLGGLRARDVGLALVCSREGCGRSKRWALVCGKLHGGRAGRRRRRRAAAAAGAATGGLASQPHPTC